MSSADRQVRYPKAPASTCHDGDRARLGPWPCAERRSRHLAVTCRDSGQTRQSGRAQRLPGAPARYPVDAGACAHLTGRWSGRFASRGCPRQPARRRRTSGVQSGYRTDAEARPYQAAAASRCPPASAGRLADYPKRVDSQSCPARFGAGVDGRRQPRHRTTRRHKHGPRTR